MIQKELRQMGISSWKTWLIGANGLKSMENMVAQGKWALSSWETWLIGTNELKFMENMLAQGKRAQVFMTKLWFPHVPCCLGHIMFLKEFLGSFVSSSRKTLGSNTPSPLTTCFNLFSLFKI
jgi:hypothetical protein